MFDQDVSVWWVFSEEVDCVATFRNSDALADVCQHKTHTHTQETHRTVFLRVKELLFGARTHTCTRTWDHIETLWC